MTCWPAPGPHDSLLWRVFVNNLPSRALQSRLSVVVTEEVTRRTKEARLELRRYMRELKKYSPEKKCKLEYDTLRVDGKTFIFREVQ